MRSQVLAVLASAASTSCIADAPSAPEGTASRASSVYVANPTSPERPILQRPVHLIEQDAAGKYVFVRPTIPPYRTSGDGRVAIDVEKQQEGVPFFVMRPEAITTRFLGSAPGIHILSNTAPIVVPTSYFFTPVAGSTAAKMQMTAICDPGNTPRTCGNDDCYDLYVLSTYAYTDTTVMPNQNRIKIFRKAVTVEVSSPKRADAQIVSVSYDPEAAGAPPWVLAPITESPPLASTQGNIDFFEPMVTGDGHLFVARLNGATVDLGDGGGLRSTNIVYAVHPYGTGVLPCDVTAWTDLKRASYAYLDPRMNASGYDYGLADRQMRDTEGKPIPAGQDLHGTYPWIDRKGNNLFFTAVKSSLHYEGGSSPTRYPAACLAPPFVGDPLIGTSWPDSGLAGPYVDLDTAGTADPPPAAAFTRQKPAPGDATCGEALAIARDQCMPTTATSMAAASEVSPQNAYLFAHHEKRYCCAGSGGAAGCASAPSCPDPATYVAPALTTVSPFSLMTSAAERNASICKTNPTSIVCADHHAYTPVSPRGPIVVHLTGLGLEPSTSDIVLRSAAFAGYRTLGLSYDTTQTFEAKCAGELGAVCSTAAGAMGCHGRARAVIAYGVPDADIRPDYGVTITTGESDSIAARLYKALTRLGWTDGLVASPPADAAIAERIRWDNIVLSGSGQGAGHALKIAEDRLLKGLVILEGGVETCRDAATGSTLSADWIRNGAHTSVAAGAPRYGIAHAHQCTDAIHDEQTAGAQPELTEWVEYTSPTRGLTFAGRWSHNKMVLLDNMLNNTDYGLRRGIDKHRMVSLYVPNGPDLGQVRVGAARDNAATELPAGEATNTTMIDSFENLFTHNPNLLASAKRDVVWLMSMGKATDEVIFDDYLDPNMLIFSEMSASLSHVEYDDQVHRDGFVYSGPESGDPLGENPRVQNAATGSSAVAGTRWEAPSYGLIQGGARIEPIAQGGIRGKGIWLDGVDDRVEYTVPVQPAGSSTNAWYAGVFVAPHFPDDNTERRLMTFVDGTYVALTGRHEVVISSGGSRARIALPIGFLPYKLWSHIGVELPTTVAPIRVFVDGFELGSTPSIATAPVGAGTITLGAAAGGFRGWVDELKVLADARGAEVYCNHARGTLLGMNQSSDAPLLWVKSLLYPAPVHTAIRATLQLMGKPYYTQYACYTNYFDESATLDVAYPAAARIRAALLDLPEFHWNQPRPNSSGNSFCLGCHASATVTSLSSSALSKTNGLAMKDDLRRQPLQPPRRIYGWAPAGYVPSTLLPSADTAPGASGSNALDKWVYP